MCYHFRDILVKEIYGSVFYLFIRNDQTVLDRFKYFINQENYFIDFFEDKI